MAPEEVVDEVEERCDQCGGKGTITVLKLRPQKFRGLAAAQRRAERDAL